MVDRIGPVNAVANAPQYDGRWERQLRGVHQAMGSASRPLGVRTGVRPGTPVTTVTATSTTWTCQPFAGEADVEAAAEAGGYPFAFDAVATGAMTPADGSNQRIDILYVQIDDPSEDGSATPAVTRKYLAGVAGSGVAPTPPVSRAFVIAEINVPKSGSGSPSVTWKPPYTAAAGGIVPFRTFAELQLWTPPQAGQYADVYGDPTSAYNRLYRYNGAAWASIGPFASESQNVNVNVSTPQNNIVVVSFTPGTFTVAPQVTATISTSPGATRKAEVQVTGISASGCQIVVSTGDGSTPSPATTVQVTWTATQMTPTSGTGTAK